MTKIPVRFALLALALALSASAFAKPKSAGLTLYEDATINGTTLSPGEYVVKYEVNGSNAQVKFMKDGHEVASADGQVKTLSHKPSSDEIILDDTSKTPSISEIDFHGKDSAISFASPGATVGK